MSENQQPVFEISKLYVKDISLELPHAPEIFLAQETPETQVDIGLENKKLDDEGYYHVQLTATITAKLSDDRILFLCQVAQGGIFRFQNIEAQDLEMLLQITCPTIIFPYLSEVIANTITRAGFPPIHLNPINFEAMYQEQLLAKQPANA